MDNFHFIDIKPKIEKHNEVSLIKDAIFKRARDKAEQMNVKQNEHYTSEVKNDIMEIASADFRSTEFNPFNKFKESIGLNKPAETKQEPEIKPETGELDNTKFKPLKHNIQSVNNSNIENSVKDETMKAARNQFGQNRNYMASLNFLNAQAAIQMAKYAHSKINYMS